jgi:glycosyltransferase involved in cell wall biosynthesis
LKIILVNKSVSGGGAALACKRLYSALSKTDIFEASILVQEYVGNNLDIKATTSSTVKRFINFLRFVWERLCFLPYERSKDIRFAFSIANTGENITRNINVKNADIIHLHWFNQGFLSLSDLKKLIGLNKPIVWTLHDMWAFTGGCHYTGECKKYQIGCNFCPYLKHPSKEDLSSIIFNKKKKILSNANITYVGCSYWIASEAQNSSILREASIVNIPNPIDIELYKPRNKNESRLEFGLPFDKKIILFGAAKVTDKRKGLEYLIKAIDFIPEEKKSNYLLVTFGRIVGMPQFSIESKTISFLNDENKIAMLYNAADVFVTPSVEDNLPNTIMEAMSCGTPVVAFNTGGIPEMVTHKTDGYLAGLKDFSDLANGINWVLENSQYGAIANAARNKVMENYTEEKIAKKYTDLYSLLLKTNESA